MEVDRLLEESESLLTQHTSAGTRLQRLSDYLRGAVRHYNWFGFYLAVPGEQLLVLGPFSGEPTEHMQIPFGRGICGQAAETGRTFLVQDVNSQDNYLACSPKVQSEVVVPVFQSGRFVGEIDIDSHAKGSFTDKDRDFLEQLATRVAPVVGELSAELAEDSGSA